MNSTLGPAGVAPTDLGPSDEQVRMMRQNLMAQITEDAPAPSTRTASGGVRRRITFAVVGVAAAAAMIAGSILLPGGSDSSAEAAAILNSAAAMTIKTSDSAAPDAGQYLKIETRANYMTVGQASTGEMVAWSAPSTMVVYKPGDPEAEWVMERHQLAPDQFFGEGAEEAALANWSEFENHPKLNGVFRAQNAAFYGAPDPAWSTDALPRDPHELHDYIRAQYNGASASPDEDAWVRITALLRTGAVPAELRAALFGAAAMIPGIEVIPGETTLDGRTGIAIGRFEANRDERQDILIDQETGELIGERTVRTEAGLGAPAGTTWSSTSVTTTVVDTAP